MSCIDILILGKVVLKSSDGVLMKVSMEGNYPHDR